ncbi:MAG: hypothetical protein ABGZ23_23600 [Fuerstiella sp.]|nr:hypothetical protein [Fuerstiella sp.]
MTKYLACLFSAFMLLAAPGCGGGSYNADDLPETEVDADADVDEGAEEAAAKGGEERDSA